MGLIARLFGTHTPEEVEARVLPVLQMMAMDGKIDAKEQATLQAHLDSLGISRDRAKELLAHTRTHTEIPLPTKVEHKIELLGVASMVMVSDGDVAPQELAYLFFLGGRMGMPAQVVQRAIDVAIEFAQRDHPGVDLKADYEAARAVLVTMALAHLRNS